MSLVTANQAETEIIEKTQKTWSKSIIQIGNSDNPQDGALLLLDELYNFKKCIVLFKPTLAIQQPVRLTEEEALSYFVSGKFITDKGFILNNFKNIVFSNSGILSNNNDILIAMGEYIFTLPDDSTITAHYTFGYEIKNAHSTPKIFLHHSSMAITE